MAIGLVILMCTVSLVPGWADASKASSVPESECEEANLMQRKTKESIEAGLHAPSVHPFVKAVLRDCAELSALDGEPSFYQQMQFLEAQKKDLSSVCRKTAFTGSARNPNPEIFEFVGATTLTLTLDPLPGVVLPKNISVGYIKAPLFFSNPERSPIYKTWFLFSWAKVQPAPKGLMFLHYGGPSPRIASDMTILGTFPKEYIEYVHDNFDLLVVDQRGMGLSSIGLLKTAESFAGLDSLKGLFGLNPSVRSSNGNLVQAVPDGKGVMHEFPCRQLAVDHQKEWMTLRDMSDLEEVNTYLEAKAKFTALCSAQFDMDDGEGGTYNLLQYMGTQALAHDLEWMRWALGAPQISLLGESYGTRAAAAYASQFPNQVHRVAVTGVMAPIPDRFDYAKAAAANTAMILGFIQEQCDADPKCTENPWKESEVLPPGQYFTGSANQAVDELFRRSANGGQWYKDHCDGKWISTLELSQQLQTYLTEIKEGQAWIKGYDQGAWPMGFLVLPALVFKLVMYPCVFAGDPGSVSAFAQELSIFNLIPALDMAGKWGKNQVAKLVTDFAKDVTFSPGLNMFSLYALQSSGWPQQPTPIGFSNADTEAVIVNALYDERTGMKNAQEFQLNFPKSSLVTALVGGHCVSNSHGLAGWKKLVAFLCYGLKPSSGDVAGPFVKLNFTKGAELVKSH